MDVARDADKRADKMYDVYCEGSYNEALGALLDYIKYLETYKDELSRYRTIDAMLYQANLMAGYVYVYGGDVTRASQHIQVSYDYHRRAMALSGVEKIPKTQFLDFAMEAQAKSDSNYEVLWRKNMRIDTNVVEAVRAKFQ
jgi:hypothetical protein